MRPSDTAQSCRVRGLNGAEEVAALTREVGLVVGGDANLAFDVLNARMTVAAGAAPADAVVAAEAPPGKTPEPWRDEATGLVW